MGRIEFIPDRSQFEEGILNGPMMRSYFHGKGEEIAAVFAATTHKKSGTNAGSADVDTATYAWVKHDRVEVTVRNKNTAYGVERELGGRRNPKPERSLYHAMVSVVGGRAVAKPRLVYAMAGRKQGKKFFKDGR